MSATAAVKSTDFRAAESVASAPGTRLVSLDVYRGLTVAGMILVTDPGTYGAVYWPLLHAQWDNPTPTDMIFPSFLFIVGMALTLSFASRIERGFDRGRLALHLLRRSAIIFVLGLAINGFPDYNWPNMRLPGILQRIAVCYLFGGLLYLVCDRPEIRSDAARRRVGNRFIAAVIAALLSSYWALLKLVPVPGFGAGNLDSRGNLAAYIDRAVFGTHHMWAYGTTPGYGVTFDPEGILSTVGALATLLIGILAGEWMRSAHSARRKILGLLVCGAVMVFASWLLHPLLPINKKIWTSTFTLESGGVSLVAFALFYWIVDVKRWRWWTGTALVLGTNSILAFVLSSVITTFLDRIHIPDANGAPVTLHQWLYQHWFALWMAPVNASLAYAIMIVLLNIAILWPLYHRRIFLRV
jgi:predicted acyltransferase